LFVGLLLVAAYLVLPGFLPPRCQVEPHWGQGGVNWFGQGPAFAFSFAAVIIVLLCSLRFVIVAMARGPADAFVWYLLLFAAMLPGVWLLVDIDWDNVAVSGIAEWVGTPIALLFVPTAFLVYDLITATHLTAWKYAARTLLEILLIPVWVYLWLMCEFLLLGWVGL